ncbi:hypothetical protein EPH95_06340 [Salicibibacter halophilus]|uniref:Uncharacterized protein n=1 Tax=Salicibibacter halophilus TaxID=2502791 RepID=A0A514LHS2_9BACI|nr:hypothetical protein [Salicibibacter halophilus]QDI90841.1 hypothetical protein EPH95_06340 [Salicibibacter halophilus]
MSEERFDRLEKHMEQLIQMVADNNKVVLENNKITQELSTRMDGLENEFADEKRLNQQRDAASQQRHKELLKEMRSQNVDIDYLRDQVSKHDMDIHNIKAKLAL